MGHNLFPVYEKTVLNEKSYFLSLFEFNLLGRSVQKFDHENVIFLSENFVL